MCIEELPKINTNFAQNLTKSTSFWQALKGFLSLNKKKEKTDAGPSPLIRKCTCFAPEEIMTDSC